MPFGDTIMKTHTEDMAELDEAIAAVSGFLHEPDDYPNPGCESFCAILEAARKYRNSTHLTQTANSVTKPDLSNEGESTQANGAGKKWYEDIDAAWQAGFNAGKLQPQPQWRPIETAPKDGTNFLGYAPSSRAAPIMVIRWNDGNWHISGAVDTYKKFVYWQPLPTPPADNNNTKEK